MLPEQILNKDTGDIALSINVNIKLSGSHINLQYQWYGGTSL